MLALYHFNLGVSLKVLYETQKDSDGTMLDEAIELQSKALQLVSTGHQWLLWWKDSLSQVFLLRFARDRNVDDLGQAKRLAQEVADTSSLTLPSSSSPIASA
jgi:hypothetical protein